ncbi:MAG: nicotinamide mononucleotide transporter [Halioglobus sp.]|jgi:nicotinamide mononucleotide transporter
MNLELSTAQVVEILATSVNLIFLVLLIKEKISCWAFGIVGSALSVYLFADAKLYWEAFLYLFYVLMGCWGWLRWHKRETEDNNPVIHWKFIIHWWLVLLTSTVALGLGYGMYSLSDAERPFFDAATTSFSFLATYMEITKVLEAWGYWLIINVASIWLYQDRQLMIYALLMGLYSVMSIWGFIRWRRTYNQQLVMS